MRGMTRWRAVVMATMLVASACGATPSGPVETGPEATQGPTASAASSAGTTGTISPTIADAALNELELRSWVRDAIGLQAVLGPDGEAILEGSDAAEATFGEAILADFVARYGLDLTAAASLGWRPTTPPVVLAEWNGSLVGNTSFMTSMWMGLAPELFGQASGDRYETGDISRTENHDSTSGGTKEHLVLTEQATVGLGEGRITVDLVLTSTSTLTDDNGNVIATRTSTGKGKFEIEGCPDASGNANGHYSVHNDEAVTDGSGASRSGGSTVDGSFAAFADDDARLTGTQFSGSISVNAQPGGGGDWGYAGSYGLSVDPSGGFGVQVGDDVTGNATPAQLSSSSWLLAMTAHYLATAAKKAESFWRSGACVELRTSRESGKVKPKEEVKLEVDAFAKFGDQDHIDRPITATFNGKESLDPAGQPVDPPATFTFKAGPDKDDKGTIELIQTSRRGIGKKTVELTVGPTDYRLDASGGGNGYTATKCGGLPGAWTINVGIPGGSGTTTFTLLEDPATRVPASSNWGFRVADATSTIVLTGTASVTVDGEGRALIHLGLGSGTLTVTSEGGTSTIPYTVPGIDSFPLEQGSFCGSGG